MDSFKKMTEPREDNEVKRRVERYMPGGPNNKVVTNCWGSWGTSSMEAPARVYPATHQPYKEYDNKRPYKYEPINRMGKHVEGLSHWNPEPEKKDNTKK